MLQVTSHLKIKLASVPLALFTRHVELSTCYGFGLKRIHIIGHLLRKKLFSSYSCIIILLAHFVFDFQGVLHDGVEIAVKRASYDGKIPCSYFENEIKIIPRLQHTNIVTLLGYCTQKSERILVLEYMPNRSLESFIYGLFLLDSSLNFEISLYMVHIFLFTYSELNRRESDRVATGLD